MDPIHVEVTKLWFMMVLAMPAQLIQFQIPKEKTVLQLKQFVQDQERSIHLTELVAFLANHIPEPRITTSIAHQIAAV